MKLIDMTGHYIVDSGHTWAFDKKPCKKEMLPMLEQNEGTLICVAVDIAKKCRHT
jgi:hypothetical protein